MAATLTSWGTDGSLALSAPLTLPAPSTRPGRDRRRALALVPPVAPAQPSSRRRGMAPATTHPVRELAVRGTVHVTRAGRLAISLLVSTLLGGGIVLGVAMVNRPGAIASASTAPALPTVVVEKGQTLSEIARDHLPDLAIHQGVVALQQANGLSTDRIMIGQRLVIPKG